MTKTKRKIATTSLQDFIDWLKGRDYRILTPKPGSKYEVARLEKYDPQGSNPHLVIYRSDKNPDELTVSGEGEELVAEYRREQLRAVS